MSWTYLFKMSWRRLKNVFKTSWRRLEDVLKTFLQDVLKMFWIRLENALKTSWRCFEDVFKMPWRRFCKTSWRPLEDVFKTSWKRLQDVWPRRICWSSSRRLETSSEDEDARHLQDVFIKTNVCWVSYAILSRCRCWIKIKYFQRSIDHEHFHSFIPYQYFQKFIKTQS